MLQLKEIHLTTFTNPTIWANFKTCIEWVTDARFHSVSFSKPNPVWFGKVTPKNCVQFSKPIPVWFGKKKMILQDADSKPNSDWFGKFWWPLSMSWKFQTKFSLVWKNHWLLPTPWTLNQFQFYFGNLILERENTQTYKYKIN